MSAFTGKNVSVIGAARSGLSAASVLVRLGANVLLSDTQPAEQMGAERLAEIQATGAKNVVGATIVEALPPSTELVVTSPGVPMQAEILQTAVRRGIPVWSEVELASRLTTAPIVAITGTNGKTTTTLLTAAMLEASGIRAIIAGNISADEIKKTFVDAAIENPTGTPGGTVLVVEISSFQLEWVEKFAPKIGILTNVMPDHLNRYASFEEYAQTKARLFAAQGQDDFAVVGWDNPTARHIGEKLPNVLRFTPNDCPDRDIPAAFVAGGVLQVRLHSGEPAIPLLTIEELPFSLPGSHSVENVLAAATAALLLGANPEAIAEAVRNFPGVAHRMEVVGEKTGVLYINNSMCTNVAAAIASLEAMTRPAIVIAGGADKGLDFTPLTATLHRKAKHLLLIGEAADKMETVFRAGGYAKITHAATLEQAVQSARTVAEAGDVVLLSPACASFDMFRDFEARGAAFRKAVQEEVTG